MKNNEVMVIDLSRLDSCRPEIRVRFGKTKNRKQKRDIVESICGNKCHADLEADKLRKLKNLKATHPYPAKETNEK